VITESWRQRFRDALARAAARVQAARAENRLIACGFTSNVDRVATLDAALLERLYGGRLVAGDRPRVALIDSVEDLLVAVAQCVAAGDGTDLIIREPAVQDWLLARMNGRQQVGGTGAQAASTLAALGFPVLLHLTDRSPAQIAALAHREMIALSAADGLVPVDAAVADGVATMWHPVLEFAAGLPAPLPGRPAAPVANRILFGYDPVNAAFSVDPDFAAALADPALAIDALLVSGFSQLLERGARARALHQVVETITRCRALRPGLFVHLELGAMPDFSAVAKIVAALRPVVSSIGLNIDELRELQAVLGVTMAAPGPALVAQVQELRDRYPVPRLSVHDRAFCLTVTDGDPERERDALLFASLVSATRARIAAFPEMDDLAPPLQTARINAAGLAFLRSLDAEEDGCAAAGVVATPGLEIAGPVATVGLGDSFTAGILAMT
jgi:ADP-dependent phosphofructokinase/glucokinase